MGTSGFIPTYIYDGSIRRDLPLWVVLFEFISSPHHQGAVVLPYYLLPGKRVQQDDEPSRSMGGGAS